MNANASTSTTTSATTTPAASPVPTTVPSTITGILTSNTPSDRLVPLLLQLGAQDALIKTSIGVVTGALLGVVLTRSGSSGWRRGLAGLGAGIGLGSSWTHTNIQLEKLLLPTLSAQTTSQRVSPASKSPPPPPTVPTIPDKDGKI